MRVKICTSCNAANGEKATYCRKCDESLEGVAIVESTEAAKADASRKALKDSEKDPKSHEPPVVMPRRPSAPTPIYWPFILSMLSLLGMFILIVAFAISSANGDDQTSYDRLQGDGATPAVTAETTPSRIDISEVMVGDIADQTYTGSEITIPFSLSYNDDVLVEGTDYTVTYSGNTAVGVVTVLFEGTGPDYAGSFETTYNIVSGDPVCDDPANREKVNFVIRMNAAMLGRAPTLEELVDEVNRLASGQTTGLAFADEIMFSEECDARALSDEEFLNWFYLGALNREADEAGLQYNIGLLADGMSREDLVNNIMSAPGGEFEVFCNSIGVAPY